jgi:hypothetical protein
MQISSLTQNLIARELRPEDGVGAAARAAFRVCQKFREPLYVLAGAAGYRSLLSRALALARPREPWLAGVKCGPDGTLEFPGGDEAWGDVESAARGGALLVTELLDLLSTLIGDTLTLRLVRNVWPDVDAPPSKQETDLS